MQGFQLIMNFLVMPIFFLSGALFPLADLPPALAVVTRLDPLTYGIDGLRGALIGVSHFGAGDRHRRACASSRWCSWRWAPAVLANPDLTMAARRRSARAHEQVLEAALELFAERGIDATSMDAIAEASGVSKATIYKHWADKDALCLEAMAHVHGWTNRGRSSTPATSRPTSWRRSITGPRRIGPQMQQAIMPHFIAHSARNKAFGIAWRTRVMQPVADAAGRPVDACHARGELRRDLSLDAATAMLVGPLLYGRFQRYPGTSRRRRTGRARLLARVWPRRRHAGADARSRLGGEPRRTSRGLTTCSRPRRRE